MKVAMINDCAYVGETILKHLPDNVGKMHIKRSRGSWSKTFGIAYNIWRAEADIYHAHYLLQDCYLASILNKKPLIGHAHGSDLRETMKHFPLGRIVRSNLEKCGKVLVSTPDLVETARQYRDDIQYLPDPVDTEFFYPKPLKKRNGKLKALIASASDWAGKGTNIAIQAMAKLRNEIDTYIVGYGKDFRRTLTLAESLGLRMQVLSKVPHRNMNQYYWDSDLVIDQFRCGVFGLAALEAIACGRPAIAFVSSTYSEYENLPMKEVNSVERIIETIKNMGNISKFWDAQYKYFRENHDVTTIVAKALKIYEELFEGVRT
jgi:glycosyltransferase involved in cell wall biosynthesis